MFIIDDLILCEIFIYFRRRLDERKYQQSFHEEKVAVNFHNMIHMVSEHISIYRYKTVKGNSLFTANDSNHTHITDNSI